MPFGLKSRAGEFGHSLFEPGKYPGKIEIMEGNGVIASLGFQLGEKLAQKPAGINAKDIYINSGGLDVLRVGENYRRRGFGSKLLTDLINYAKKHNLGNIYLRVNKSNLPAVGLYNKMGFKVVRELGNNEQLMAYYRV
jgi:ribosomal protein S18 acetylase RimI-like enzyme